MNNLSCSKFIKNTLISRKCFGSLSSNFLLWLPSFYEKYFDWKNRAKLKSNTFLLNMKSETTLAWLGCENPGEGVVVGGPDEPHHGHAKMIICCAGCGRPIMDKFLLTVLDRTWHAECVRCVDCGNSLTEKCFSREDKLYCRTDFFR